MLPYPILVPATEVEICEVLRAANHEQGLVIRKLALQRDLYKLEIERLKRGDFTEGEFQNLCHNFSKDDERRFKQGCLDYQNKLFGVPPYGERP